MGLSEGPIREMLRDAQEKRRDSRTESWPGGVPRPGAACSWRAPAKPRVGPEVTVVATGPPLRLASDHGLKPDGRAQRICGEPCAPASTLPGTWPGLSLLLHRLSLPVPLPYLEGQGLRLCECSGDRRASPAPVTQSLSEPLVPVPVPVPVPTLVQCLRLLPSAPKSVSSSPAVNGNANAMSRPRGVPCSPALLKPPGRAGPLR